MRLRSLGHDAVHTLDLPLGNRTPDQIIEQISLSEKRVVISKDIEFVDSLILYGKPFKLLLISTGNIRNAELEMLIFQNIEQLVEAFEQFCFIEMDRTAITVHQ